MGRSDFTKHGDWNAICDKCGMKYKASTMRTQWDNLFVCRGCFDVRHPQDFVQGIPEDQTVSIARPDVISSMGSTTVKTTALKNATTIDITSITGIVSGDPINIVLDNGNAHWTYSNGTPSGYTVTLGSYLPYGATAGNVVYLPAINDETFITATDITATGL